MDGISNIIYAIIYHSKICDNIFKNVYHFFFFYSKTIIHTHEKENYWIDDQLSKMSHIFKTSTINISS